MHYVKFNWYLFWWYLFFFVNHWIFICMIICLKGECAQNVYLQTNKNTMKWKNRLHTIHRNYKTHLRMNILLLTYHGKKHLSFSNEKYPKFAPLYMMLIVLNLLALKASKFLTSWETKYIKMVYSRVLDKALNQVSIH